MKKVNIRLLIIGLAIILCGCKTEVALQSYNYENMRMDQMTDSIQDESFLSILEPYKKEIEGIMSQVVAVSEMQMKIYRPENPLSNLLSDIVYEEAVIWCKDSFQDCSVDFALINHGGIRSFLPQGNITMENIFSLMPFENELVLIQVRGEKVKELFDHLAYRDGEAVSRASFGIKDGKAVNSTIKGRKIEDDRLYWIATSDYLANGGDGMKALTCPNRRVSIGIKIRDAIAINMKRRTQQGKTISSELEGRVYYAK